MPDLVVTPLWVELLQARAEGKRWSARLGKVDCPPLSVIPNEIQEGRSPLAEPAHLYLCAFGRLRAKVTISGLRNGVDGFLLDVDDLAELEPLTIGEEVPRWWRAWRQVWWKPADERPFPGWATHGVPSELLAQAGALGSIVGHGARSAPSAAARVGAEAAPCAALGAPSAAARVGPRPPTPAREIAAPPPAPPSPVPPWVERPRLAPVAPCDLQVSLFGIL